MISRYTHRGLTWIDLECPTKEEAAAIAEEYSLHPVIANDILTTSDRAKVDVYENAIYLVLHFPIRNRTTGHIQEAEIDFVLLKDTLITVHYEMVDPLHDFARIFEFDSYLSNSNMGEHAGFLFVSQVRELYKHTLFILDSVEQDIRTIEKDIFNGDEAAMVSRLSLTNRALLDVRSALRQHKETVKSFSHASTKLYGPEFASYAGMIESEYAHIEQSVEENRQMLQDMRRTNDSLLSAKTNATIRRLTVVNVILLPMALVAQIFAMHSQYLYLDDAWQLLAAFAGMAAICLISIIYFHSKKWL